MLICQGKVHRNLQEQVVKNMEDIEFILRQRGVLNEYGLRIVDIVEYLPSVNDYKTANAGWQYGDTLLMGDAEPYTGYILFKANGDHASDYWFELGDVPLAGPQGPKGDTGEQGPKGDPGEDGADGTQIIANPTTTGTEDSLTSIEIDGTKYIVGGGGKMYMHHCKLSDTASNYYASAIFISSNNTSMTLTDVAHFLYSNGFTDGSYGYSLVSMRTTPSDNRGVIGGGLYCFNNTSIYLGMKIFGITDNALTVTDSYMVLTRLISDTIIEL